MILGDRNSPIVKSGLKKFRVASAGFALRASSVSSIQNITMCDILEENFSAKIANKF